jgi:hypothetical protein
MAWESYRLDRYAQELVLSAKKRNPDSLNQSYKMRLAAAYGLERFWGEQFRLRGDLESNYVYWQEVWGILVRVMATAGVEIPNDLIPIINDNNNQAQIRAQTDAIEQMSNKLWGLSLEDQRVTLAVLTGLCDALVWWNQRYK